MKGFVSATQNTAHQLTSFRKGKMAVAGDKGRGWRGAVVKDRGWDSGGGVWREERAFVCAYKGRSVC